MCSNQYSSFKEEIDQLVREQARREAYLAREKAAAEDQKAKKLKG